MKKILTLRETQLLSLDILKRVDAICKSEGLRYYLAHGSLLGAIRHKGFIPWDDDLDIAMPREDYDLLLAYFEHNKSALMPLVAIHNTTDRKLPFLITRISNTNYKEIGEFSYDAPELGAFIDIYPLDGVGSSMDEGLAEKARCHKLIKQYSRAGNFKSNNLKCGKIKKISKLIYSRILKPCSYYESLIYDSTSHVTYESSEYVACKVWMIPQIERLVIKKTWIGDGAITSFEGFPVPIPACSENILSMEYGDYMQLPPEEERVGHHDYQIVARDDCSIK